MNSKGLLLILILTLMILQPSSALRINIPSGSLDWNDLTNVPAGFADNIDNSGGTPDWNTIINTPQLCYANGTGCTDYNSSGLIKDWNISGQILNWNISGNIQNWNVSGLIRSWDVNSLNSTGLVKDWGSASDTNDTVDLHTNFYNKTDVDINISTNNQSVVSWVTNTFYLASNPLGFITSSALVPYTPLTTLNNGSYFNPDLAPYVLWSQIYNFIYNKTEIDAMNVSNNNYILQNNNSINNGYTAQDNSYNTSNNNYALALNTSNNNYVVGTMLGRVYQGGNGTATKYLIFALNNGTNLSVSWDDISGGGAGDGNNNVTYINTTNDTNQHRIYIGRTNLIELSTAISDIDTAGSDNNITYINVTNDTGQHIIRIGRTNLPELSTAINDQTGGGSGSLLEWYNSTNTTFYNQTSSAVDKIISELNVSLLANSKYRVNCDIWYRTGVATTGITLNISFSAGVTSHTLRGSFPASATSITWLNETATTGYAGFNATGSAGVNINGELDIEGYITTGANAVNLIYKFKSELVSPQWTGVSKDSDCNYVKVA